jgi:hypothetical protein
MWDERTQQGGIKMNRPTISIDCDLAILDRSDLVQAAKDNGVSLVNCDVLLNDGTLLEAPTVCDLSNTVQYGPSWKRKTKRLLTPVGWGEIEAGLEAA